MRYDEQFINAPSKILIYMYITLFEHIVCADYQPVWVATPAATRNNTKPLCGWCLRMIVRSQVTVALTQWSMIAVAVEGR